MKRAYKKRKSNKYNYSALVAMLAVLIMVVVCVAGIFMIVKLTQEKINEGDVAKESSSRNGSSELETVTKEIATQSPTPETKEATTEATTKATEVTTTPTQAATSAPATPSQPSVNEPPAVVDDIPATKQDYSCFAGSAILGDSRVGSIYLSIGSTPAKFYYKIGLQIHKFTTDVGIQGNNTDPGITIIDLLKKESYNKIFIQIGVNWTTIADANFITHYTNLINAVKSVQPGAEIYIMSVIPESAAHPEENNNIKRLNGLVPQIASNCGVNYINLAPVFGNNDSLPAGAYNPGTDGAHLNQVYNYRVMNYIKRVVYGQ